jgi:hypothetical protein
LESNLLEPISTTKRDLPVMNQKALRGIELVAVGQVSILKAQNRLTGCAICCNSASLPFESVITEVLDHDGSSEYFLCSPAKCPRCNSILSETTLVSANPKTLPSALRAEETDVVFVNEATLFEAQNFLTGCEHCDSERAELSFDQILDEVTGCDPSVTEYVICHAARCPRCHRNVMENTLVSVGL